MNPEEMWDKLMVNFDKYISHVPDVIFKISRNGVVYNKKTWQPDCVKKAMRKKTVPGPFLISFQLQKIITRPCLHKKVMKKSNSP